MRFAITILTVTNKNCIPMLIKCALAFLLVVLTFSPSSVSAQEDLPVPVVLKSSWPSEETVLWTPIREGHLVFSAPVNGATAKYDLTATNALSTQPFRVERMAYGISTDTVIFKMPELLAGSYTLSWSIESGQAVPLKGTINFSQAETFVAPGGANHRMDGTVIVSESRFATLLKALSLTIVGLLVAAFRREKNPGNSVYTKSLAGSLSLIGAIGLLVTLYASLGVRVHTDAMEHYSVAFTSPLLWVYVGLLFYGLIVIRTGQALLSPTAVILVSAGFALSRDTSYGSVEYARVLLDTVAFCAVVNIVAYLFGLLHNSYLVKTASAYMRSLYQWFTVLALSSLATVYAQANFNVLAGKYQENFIHKIVLSTLGFIIVSVLSILTKSGTKDPGEKSLIKIVAPVLIGTLVVTLCLLLIVPPPVVPGL